MKPTPTKIKHPPLTLLGAGGVDDMLSDIPEKYVPSGVATLDRLILGAVSSEMTLIAGPSGMGKTSLAMQWAITNAQSGAESAATMVLSLEMGRRAIRNRLISSLTGIDMVVLRTKAWENKQQQGLAAQAAEYLQSIPLYVDDRSGMGAAVAYDAIMHYKRAGIGLVIVDYVQEMSGDNDSRVTIVGDSIRALKAGAKDADIPVIGISSLNRSSTGGKPKKSQLRDSGDLEYVTDTIIMLHYPEDDEYEPVRVAEIHVVKQRNGPVGMAPALFHKAGTKFTVPE